MTNFDKALVVLSGGQDSTTCLYWAKNRFREVHAVSFDYGQRHRVELESARTVAAMAEVSTHQVLTVPPGLLKSTSPLVDPAAELERYPDPETMAQVIGERVELTFVPMRNALFLTVAANHAIALGCRTLVTGVCGEDNANYPDCREAFVEAQTDAINQALGIRDFVIHAPLMHKSKPESVQMARLMLGCWDALGYSHTCYAGQVPPCGTCHACVLRADGFEKAGEIDPLILRTRSAA